MAVSNELDQLRTYATKVSDCARTIVVPDGLEAQRDELAGLASQIVADIDTPLRIGFVGEFSAGKSLLLGVLAGKPNLLPTNKNPTTGNITELRFAQSAGESAQTEITRAQVRFFSRDELDLLDRQSMDELRGVARAAGLSAAQVAELGAVSAAGFQDWCTRAWQVRDTTLRKLIREVLFTRAAASAASGWLGQTIDIGPDQFRRVLEIPYPTPSDDFAEPPSRDAIPFTNNPTDSQMARVFPLVDRVVLDIALSAAAWDISAVHGDNGFVLLDFPGIGGGLTRVRDLFLTRRGLEDTHTILVLVNAERPGGDAPDKFYGFLQALDASRPGQDTTAEPISSRIVYCAGRFDEMPAPELSEADLAGDGRMTEDKLVSSSSALNALLQSGHRPGISAMQAFVSSVLAISRLGLKDVPSDLQFEYYRHGAEAKADKWRRIAESLKAGATGGNLAAELLAYADDGGVWRLQRLLEDHVRDHGLELRIQRAQQQLDRLDELKAALESGLRNAQKAEDAGTVDATVRVRELLRVLRNSRKDLYSQMSLLRSPDHVLLAPGWSLRQDVAQKAADQVMAWPEWETILSCVEDGVVVPPIQANGSTRPLDPEATEFPQTLGDFEPAFVQTCDDLRDYVQERALVGITRWLSARSAAPATVQLRRQVATVLGPDVQERLANGPLADLRTVIDLVVNPAMLSEDIANHVGQPDQQIPDQPVFPLRTEQLASWATESSTAEMTRHLVRVLRTRSALIDSATRYAFRCLDVIQERIVEELQGRYDSRAAQLPDGRQQRPLIRAVLGDQAGQHEQVPDPAGALAELQRPDGVAGFGV